MNAKPTSAAKGSITTFAAATLATVIALGILSSIAFLFQRDGKPLERLVEAERACSHYNYVSDRQACVNNLLATAQPESVARK